MRRLAAAGLAAAAVSAALLAPVRGESAGPKGILSAEFDAFAVRIEYDLPIPAGTGTIPHVVGEVRRSGAGENAKGLAAAPTHFDPVVGGTYYDPDKSQKGDERSLPQVECFYPGDLLDTSFRFPTQTQAETQPLPPTSYATARCGAGPEAELRALVATQAMPAATVGGGAADGLARTVERRLEATASARATDVSLAGGAITVRSIEATGRSQVTGTPDGAASEASIVLEDVDVGGVRFSLANDRLVVARQEVPVGSAPAQQVIDAANAAIAPTGCRVDLTTTPAQFPQGFLLGRKPPAIGVTPDGRRAASMRSGLQVLCDIPAAVAEPTGFNPQRLQAVLGFVYTGAEANTEPGGFGLGNLADLDFGPLEPPPPAPVTAAAPPTPIAAPAIAVEPVPVATSEAAPAPPPPAVGAEPAVSTRPRVRVIDLSMDPAARATLAALSLAAWAALTHLGIRRLRGVTEP